MRKGKINTIIIFLIIFVVLVVILFWGSLIRTYSKPEITGNFIGEDNEGNSTNLESKNIEKEKIYATDTDIHLKIKWVDEMQISDEFPKNPPNCNQERGDIWAELSITNPEVNIVDYGCRSEILSGDISVVPGIYFPLLRKNDGYFVDEKVGVSQDLRKGFSVRVWCYPYEKEGYPSYKITTEAKLSAYC